MLLPAPLEEPPERVVALLAMMVPPLLVRMFTSPEPAEVALPMLTALESVKVEAPPATVTMLVPLVATELLPM